MNRPLCAPPLAAVVAAACATTPSSPTPFLVVSPILDSLFVGDTLPRRAVTLYDAQGHPQNPGAVSWSITPTSVATIDAASGVIRGVGKGEALITAHAAGLTAPGVALVVVSRRLDMTLLMDTAYLMRGDTFTIPLAIQKKDTARDTVWFDPSVAPAVYTITTDSGRVTALAGGPPLRYVAHVATRTDSVADTGAVWVLAPGDTTGGRFYWTIFGTATRHAGGPARALNYTTSNGSRAFRLTDSLFASSDSTRYEKLYLTLPDSVIAPHTVDIDSISPQQAGLSIGPLPAFCTPPRPWGIWSSIVPAPELPIRAYSALADAKPHAGRLSITQYRPVTGGVAISGRYLFTAQRSDIPDTLGILTIRGTFVAPLLTTTTVCHS